MYTIEKTKKKIQEILERHNLNINIISEDISIVFSYSRLSNSINFNQYMLFDLYNKFIMFKPEDIIEVAVYHEIGHYLYHQRHSTNNDSRNTKELLAWEYGRELVPDELKLCYNEVEKVFNI